MTKSSPPLPFPDRQNESDGPEGFFAVVIPVYNHGATAAEVVRRAAQLGFPVIVVDDGSTDGGCDNLEALPGIRVVRHPQNLGKGAALQTGMLEAAQSARWAICMDADGQHHPEDMLQLVKGIPAGLRPIVVGRRQAMETAPWTSRFGRKFSNFWVWVASGMALSDSQSGFRIYPLPEVFDLGVRAGRYQYEIEVLARAAWHGVPVMEAPVSVSYAPGGRRISHFRPWVDFMRNSRTFARLIVRRVFTPRLWKFSKGRNTIPRIDH
jgi:glycosyltransferase involved in cell wall biosynthesis